VLKGTDNLEFMGTRTTDYVFDFGWILGELGIAHRGGGSAREPLTGVQSLL